MKIKKYKNLIIIIVCIIIGFITGYFSSLFLNKEDVKEEIQYTPSTDITYIENIQESKYNNNVVNGYITELQNLNQRINEINSEKQDIEAKISSIKHKLNNSTDFVFENEIYPEDNIEE